MKGVVFTEFLEMVEAEYGYELVDKLLDNPGLESGGVYTTVGTYSHGEMVLMLTQLSKEVGADPHVLLKAFGNYICGYFTKHYEAFYKRADNLFSFLISIEEHIHVEVRKLYPDAELPKFDTEIIDENNLKMIYSSKRKMSDLAVGLIEKSAEYYKETVTIKKSNISEDETKVEFIVTKVV